ncbi:Lactonase, 7-bladed beta-propeller-domain-containing protein [Mycena floridula]|nr:Lactonase, 7-bladed beta-propeller-domain-containing protein [Mycena floridula]
MEAQAAFNISSDSSLQILSGSFKSISLFLLAFSPIHRSLSLLQTVEAFGPHQYLAANPRKDCIYTTSWALPPVLSSWRIQNGHPKITSEQTLNNETAATSSYINIPPPFTHIYSAGGPTGEVHVLDPATGAFGETIQQVLFVPEEELEKADKTRVALRYGSHAVEFSTSTGHAFIPVLGTDSIEMYNHDRSSGLLTHIFSSPSPRGPGGHDGPRHVKIHPNGKILYCVTEHSEFIFIPFVPLLIPSSRQSSRFLPNSARFARDTLLLTPSTPSHPSPSTIFATTRGGKSETRGWLSVFQLNADGTFADTIERYETSTSGGKANAIDLYPKSLVAGSVTTDVEPVWILLTDDDDAAGGIRVLEWDGWKTGGFREVAAWPAAGETMESASHAIWLA